MDSIIKKKIIIWLNLPITYKLKIQNLKSMKSSLILYWNNNCIIIKEILIFKQFRRTGICKFIIINLEELAIKYNFRIKIQSILNPYLWNFLKDKNWKKIKNELSLLWNEN